MKILVLTKSVALEGCGGYHGNLLAALAREHALHCYGPGHKGYSPGDGIKDVLRKCPFTPDVLLVGTSWEEQSETVPESDPHPAIRLAELTDVPKVFFLNKEYKKLDKKLQYVRQSKFDAVLSFHRGCRQWESQTGTPFYHVPFAVDAAVFHDHGLRRRYDFGFSGGLHRAHTDVRFRVKQTLFRDAGFPANVGVRYTFRGSPLKDCFRRRRIYWVEWGAVNLLGRPLIRQGNGYAKLLSRCRVFLCTPSAMDLVGTRFYEVMASRTLALCPRSPAYKELFEEDRHYVAFKPDMSDFAEKLEYYLDHEDEREAICDQAYAHVMANHTWRQRAERISASLAALVKR